MRGGAGVAAALLLGAAGQPVGPAAAEPPGRIVVAGGALTEIVYALGLQERIVGVDATGLFPPAAASHPQIGYYRQLAAEGILSLAPDLLLASDDAGPPATLVQVEGAGVPVVVVDAPPGAAGVLAAIRRVGAALEAEPQADAMAEAVAADFAAVEAAVEAAGARVAERPKLAFVMGFNNGAPMVAGAGSVADVVLDLAGAANAFAGIEGYKMASTEAVAASAPDWIVVAEHAVASMGGLEAIAALPAFAPVEAAAEGRIVAFDALYLIGMGPRTPFALRDLAARIHPDWPDPALPDRPWLHAAEDAAP